MDFFLIFFFFFFAFIVCLILEYWTKAGDHSGLADAPVVHTWLLCLRLASAQSLSVRRAEFYYHCLTSKAQSRLYLWDTQLKSCNSIGKIPSWPDVCSKGDWHHRCDSCDGYLVWLLPLINKLLTPPTTSHGLHKTINVAQHTRCKRGRDCLLLILEFVPENKKWV